jgi:hypothetical protein
MRGLVPPPVKAGAGKQPAGGQNQFLLVSSAVMPTENQNAVPVRRAAQICFPRSCAPNFLAAPRFCKSCLILLGMLKHKRTNSYQYACSSVPLEMKKEKQDKRTNLRWNCRAKKLLHFPCSKCGGV